MIGAMFGLFYWMIVLTILIYWYMFKYMAIAVWWVSRQIWMWWKKRQGEIAAVEATQQEYREWLIEQAEKGHQDYLAGGDGLIHEEFQPSYRRQQPPENPEQPQFGPVN